MRPRTFMRCMRVRSASRHRTLEVIDGGLPRRAMGLMLEWALEHRAELMEIGTYAIATSRRTHSSAAVPPVVRPAMPWRVMRFEALQAYRLRVRFLDGLEVVVDMSGLVASPNAGVFAALADSEAFNRVFVALSAVC